MNKPPPLAGNEQLRVNRALQQAIQLQMQGKLDQAALQYLEILKSSPSHFDAKHLLGIIRAQQGRHLEALDLIGAALKINPNDAPALSNFGIVLQRSGHSERALASFDRALAIQPGHVDALFNRGLALIALGRPEGALASFDKALAIQPNYVDALNNRALVLVALGRPGDALASFDKALAIQPNYVEALNNVGVILSSLKRPERALASFDKALKIKPDYVEAWLNRGNTLFDCNLNNEAIESCQRALSIDHNSSPARFDSCIHELQILYLHEEEILSRRTSYEQKLRSVCEDVERGSLKDDAFSAVRSLRPFYLAYQGSNDRELQRLSGELTCRIIGQAFPETSLLPTRAERTGPSRVRQQLFPLAR